MSNDENANGSAKKAEELINNLEETAEDVIENIKETVDDVVENIEETVDDVVETAEDVKDSIMSKATDLKESNPKVFYGGIGVLVLGILALLMSGGSNTKNLPAPRAVNLEIGQTYALKGVNSFDSDATVRLVSVPGSMAAYDEAEEVGEGKNEATDCKRMPQLTKVKLTQLQDATGATYAQVEMIAGKCAGRKGWVISNNLIK
jgi:ElaB/YqjD/DUF883 family membrane-anchored ribosome-binding protein